MFQKGDFGWHEQPVLVLHLTILKSFQTWKSHSTKQSLRAVSTQPDMGLEPTNREIVTWALKLDT